MTLSTELVFRGLVLVQAGGVVPFGEPKTVTFFGRGRLLEVPTPTVVFLVVGFIGHAIFTFYKTGYRIHAPGGIPAAARRLGVTVDHSVGAKVPCGWGIKETGRAGTFAVMRYLILLVDDQHSNPFGDCVTGNSNRPLVEEFEAQGVRARSLPAPRPFWASTRTSPCGKRP